MKATLYTIILALLFINCNDKHQQQTIELLDNKQIPLIYTFKSDGFYNLEMNLNKKFLVDTTLTYEGICYHSFNIKENVITLIMMNKKNNRWESFEFTISDDNMVEEIKENTNVNFDIDNSTIKNIVIRKDGNILYELKNGTSIMEYYKTEKIDYTNLKKLNITSVTNKFSNSKTSIHNETNLEDFEYSDKWRKEAYRVAKQFLIKKVNSDDPTCNITRQGLYQPNLVRYIGGQGYLIQLYCEFDCGNDYNNPSVCLIEGYYLGNNRWDMKLVKQKFVD